MLTVTRKAPDRVDIELKGSFDATMMVAALDDLIAKSGDVEHGRMLYTITDFSMPSPGALAVELQRLPKLFGLLGRYDRCAVLCDTGWLRTVAEIEGALIPGLEIKSFTLDERAAAEAWLEV